MCEDNWSFVLPNARFMLLMAPCGEWMRNSFNFCVVFIFVSTCGEWSEIGDLCHTNFLLWPPKQAKRISRPQLTVTLKLLPILLSHQWLKPVRVLMQASSGVFRHVAQLFSGECTPSSNHFWLFGFIPGEKNWWATFSRQCSVFRQSDIFST